MISYSFLNIKYQGMIEAGKRLSQLFSELKPSEYVGMSTLKVDMHIRTLLEKYALVSQALGYQGYPCVSCISLNDEVVHGIPKEMVVIKEGDLLKIDICASYNGYCADMARSYSVASDVHSLFIQQGQEALDAGISKCEVGKTTGDIGHAVHKVVEKYGYSTVEVFCGHGIGKKMHEEPQVPNWGMPRRGALLKAGMGLAIEPMFMVGKADIVIDNDGWTARSKDGSLALHIEDTVFITEHGPIITTRVQ